MPLTRQLTVRTCRLWEDYGRNKSGLGTSERLFKAFYRLLADLYGNSASEPNGAELARFMLQILERGEAEAVRAYWGRRLAVENSFDIAKQWQSPPKPQAKVLQQLFPQPMDRVAPAFYLAQVLFVLGYLRLAKAYACDAYRALQEAEPTAEKGSSRVKILRLLVMSLVLEITYLAQGCDPNPDQQPEPLRARFLAALSRETYEVIQGVEPKRFWDPIPLAMDLEEARREAMGRISTQKPLDLAFELTRKNAAGILLFQHRKWGEVEEIFEYVRTRLAAQRSKGAEWWHPSLDPIEQEANVFIARLKVQRCEFTEAESLLTGALDYFSRARDLFAENKVLRYWAEMKYRQFDWRGAEELFLKVLDTSREWGFDRDAAVVELSLGKLYSRFGFQTRAADYLESAAKHFRRYDLLGDKFDCLFWQAVSDNRALSLDGHPADRVVDAAARVQVYGKLYRQLKRDSQGAERQPYLIEIMRRIRLGELPDIQEMEVGREQERQGKEKRSRKDWRLSAHANLYRQVVRLVYLQRKGPQPDALPPPPLENVPHIRKFLIRDVLIDALEILVYGRWNPKAVCQKLSKACGMQKELRLHGQFIPFLVDLDQFFADRDCFIVILLLLQEAIDKVLIQQQLEAAAEDLKVVYRSITKYLVLERNLYLGVPAFEGNATPELWEELQKKWPKLSDWERIYRNALKGDHGLSYPNTACGLGWVDEVQIGSAVLRVCWLAQRNAQGLTWEDFEPLEVPIEVVRDGHAAESLAPIVLIGRSGNLDGGRGLWVAHHLPNIEKEELFLFHEEDPGYRPRLEVWERLARRFSGSERHAFQTPRVAPEDVEARARQLETEWLQVTEPALGTCPAPPEAQVDLGMDILLREVAA